MRKLELVTLLGDLRLWLPDPQQQLLWLHDNQRSSAGLSEDSGDDESMWLLMQCRSSAAAVHCRLRCCFLRCDQHHVPV
jgi:hypothetical protein